MIISRDMFRLLMTGIEIQHMRNQEVSRHLNAIMPESTPSVFSTPLIDTTIKFLEIALDDTHENISWWIWERDWGRDDTISMFNADHTEIPMDTVDDLYDYLTRNKEKDGDS